MEIFESDFINNHSDFDDRIEEEEAVYESEKEENDPIKEEENFYRHLEEY